MTGKNSIVHLFIDTYLSSPYGLNYLNNKFQDKRAKMALYRSPE